MTGIQKLESQLNEVFGKQAPKLPDNGKKILVEWLPILMLVCAAITVFAAWGLWSAATRTSGIVKLTNELSKAYGDGTVISTNELTPWVWSAIAFLGVMTALYLMAYNPLKARLKRGWDLLFYASLVSLAYSAVTLFVDGRGFGSLLFGLVGTAIGWWLLFQVRPAYAAKAAAPKKTAPKK
ncbi:hypothetical protein CSA80_00330 [Candidatus Saccharibacteria bacterium]|nr:MAG: hypothetical protein CR973_00615 [Candidatus Saccharibacteria bacterium]PID99616.1 MAG: hypothetical protein CSA80_00330 [Candidatus Saccharibacteria bacterium]